MCKNLLKERFKMVYVISRAQGALLAHVLPEDLMSYSDYCDWKKMERERSCDRDVKSRDRNSERVRYERISCRAWTDLLLQLLKVTFGSSFSPLSPASFTNEFSEKRLFNSSDFCA